MTEQELGHLLSRLRSTEQRHAKLKAIQHEMRVTLDAARREAKEHRERVAFLERREAAKVRVMRRAQHANCDNCERLRLQVRVKEEQIEMLRRGRPLSDAERADWYHKDVS
jgi:molybdenum cofactor biosynthesis enzyme MoaA